ncbi:hypothetical protein VPH35_006587 [Triticum aestivum]
MQPIRRIVVMEEVSDSQLPMEPLHHPAVATEAEQLPPMRLVACTGRSVRRRGESQARGMLNRKHLRNLLHRLIRKHQAGLAGLELEPMPQEGHLALGEQAPLRRQHGVR